jgi:hypothetical protein
VIGGSWRPTATQELLLNATVGDPAGAAVAFARWRQAQDLALIDDGSARLLPLLVPRASLFPADDPAWPVIRGCYRRAFFHGQMLRARAAEATALLADAGIATLALKGGALLRYYDGNPALRPMNDFDGLVPRERAVEAIRILMAHGWSSALPLPELLPEAYHSACFTSRDGLDFDLHWHVVPSNNNPASEASAWSAAIPCDMGVAATPGNSGGVAIRALCPEDLLTVVCAHAAQWSPIASVRWVADSLAIRRGEVQTFDWARVAAQAVAWHVVPHLTETLRYLRDRWRVDVPGIVFAQLASIPVPAVDRRAYAVLGRMPGTADYLARPWHRYRVRSREKGAMSALPGFVRYLQITLGRARVRDLPSEILMRFRRWRRDRANGRR